MLMASHGDTTLGAAARRLGMSTQGLSHKLRGDRRWSVDDLDLIASTYAVDVRALLAPAWTATDLPEATNKVTFARLSFRQSGRRGWAVPGGIVPGRAAA